MVIGGLFFFVLSVVPTISTTIMQKLSNRHHVVDGLKVLRLFIRERLIQIFH